MTAVLRSNAHEAHNLPADRDNFQVIPSSQNQAMPPSILPSGHAHQGIIYRVRDKILIIHTLYK